MKMWLWIGSILVVLSLSGLAWHQHIQAVRAEAIVATLEVERDAAIAERDSLEREAARAAETADSIAHVRDAERLATAVTVAVLRTKADSLVQEIITISDSGPTQDTTRVLLDSLQANHRAEVQEYVDLLTLSDETIDALQKKSELDDRIKASLNRALVATTGQRDALAAAANPGLITRIRQDTGLLGAAVGLGIGIGLALAGGG